MTVVVIRESLNFFDKKCDTQMPSEATHINPKPDFSSSILDLQKILLFFLTLSKME